MAIQYRFIKVPDINFLSTTALFTLLDKLTALYNQLSPTSPINLQHLYDACGTGNQLLVAYDSPEPLTHVVGICSLVPIHTPRGVDGTIEDVVVDEKYRGQKIGYQMIRRLLEKAKSLNMETVYLTSNPTRQKANKLYQDIGFEQYETNNYRYPIKEA